ncbi:spore coat protein [Paenibacillus thermoaerophilus]|uniref:Spore coat protein n=1 Tax=Paenibacillus thermoaerophilus TaxID=1215385 RepID=A0ABW2V4H6_9BACL|nr:spore coat protein [Paenibacillus thermoaerophilus]TMV15923.1 spore coat protein [Paenibacillus thermoaerophilus]
MPTTIQAPQASAQQTPQGPEFSDRDRINDMLAYEKYLTNGYNTALCEMQMPKLHQDIQATLNDVHELQAKMFNLMFNKGWYKLQAADPQQISQKAQQFQGYKSQFPSH